MLEVRVKDDNYNHASVTKIASRGFVIKDNKIAILYSKKYGAYITPGGGVEAGETLEEACIREVKEEMGFIVNPIRQIAKLDCDYPKARIEHHFFVCELVSDDLKTDRTRHEQDQDLEIKWLSIKELRAAYSTISESYKYDLWMQREGIIIPELRNYVK